MTDQTEPLNLGMEASLALGSNNELELCGLAPMEEAHLASQSGTTTTDEKSALRREPNIPKALPDEMGTRERLRRHRIEVGGQVWIPDKWGQEELLNEWIDCPSFDASLAPGGLLSARKALENEGSKSTPGQVEIKPRVRVPILFKQ